MLIFGMVKYLTDNFLEAIKMAKCRTTRKWINENFLCISAGYCDLQYLLYYQNEDYYTCGVYGWNFDCYTFGDYAITTGYRNMIDNIPKDYSSLIHEYNNKAREIVENWEYKGDKRQDINKLLKEFLSKVFEKPEDRFYIY